MRPTVARNVKQSLVVPKVARRIAPRSKRSALAVDTSLRTVGSILGENLASVVRIHQDGVVRVPHERARAVDGLEGVAGAVP